LISTILRQSAGGHLKERLDRKEARDIDQYVDPAALVAREGGQRLGIALIGDVRPPRVKSRVRDVRRQGLQCLVAGIGGDHHIAIVEKASNELRAHAAGRAGDHHHSTGPHWPSPELAPAASSSK
jgi:hypothetical protein